MKTFKSILKVAGVLLLLFVGAVMYEDMSEVRRLGLVLVGVFVYCFWTLQKALDNMNTRVTSQLDRMEASIRQLADNALSLDTQMGLERMVEEQRRATPAAVSFFDQR